MPECSNCGKNLSTNQSLIYHQNKRVCQKKQCSVCGKIYRSRQGLDYHLKKSSCGVIHRVKERPENREKIRIRKKQLLYDINKIDFSQNSLAMETVRNDTSIFQLTKTLLTSEQFREYWCVYVDRAQSKYIYVFSTDADGRTRWQLRPRNMVLDCLIGCLAKVSSDREFLASSTSQKKVNDFKDYICCILHSNRENVYRNAQDTGHPIRM